MWTWSLNWGEVTPHIVIGACPMTPDDLKLIHAGAGVSAVLSLQHDDCLAYWGIDYTQMRQGRDSIRQASTHVEDVEISTPARPANMKRMA